MGLSEKTDNGTNAENGGNDEAEVARKISVVQPEGATRCSDQSPDCKVKHLTCSLTGMAPLFTPLKVGSLQLTHRVVLAPLTRCRASVEGVPSVDLAGVYYAQRTTKGGLLISEATPISQQGTGHFRVPGIYTDAQVEGWKGVTQAVKQKGGYFFMQLWHVGRGSHSKYQPDGQLPVAPSAIAVKGETALPDGSTVPYEVPRELRAEDEIPAIVADYAKAAKNAFLAGFDGVEIHGANGYLIDQFLHNGSNKRTDKYGGSIENRTRFLLEVIEAVQTAWVDAVGPKSPLTANVGLRLAPFGTYLDMSDTEEAVLYKHVITEINKFHLAYVHIVEPRVTGSKDLAGTAAAEAVHSMGKLFDGPVITAGGYRPDSANTVVMEAAHDASKKRSVAVAFGRLFISNPDLPLRIFLRAPLQHYNRATFYSHDEVGYTDQPMLSATEIQSYTQELRVEEPDNEKLQKVIQSEIQLLKV